MPSKTHGHSCGRKLTRAYKAWSNMNRRCRDDERSRDRGSVGIGVCERWRGPDGFAHFLEDMGEPGDGLVLDRRDVSKGYDPGNCRWATKKEQLRKTRSSRMITHKGRTMCLSAWAEEIGITKTGMWKRFSNGWTIERALETPVQVQQEGDAPWRSHRN
jgi:hypothetical protein